MSWKTVIPHFENFLNALELTEKQRTDALEKTRNVGSSLYRHYYGSPFFDPKTVRIVGSHGKGTAVRPPSDVDVLFMLPTTEFTRINQRIGNIQSQLLQEIKSVLVDTFPRTDVSADGQVVKAPFSDYAVEIVPAFLRDDGKYVIGDSNMGGRWKITDPNAEILEIQNIDSLSAGKATHLIKMLKAWKRTCNVEIKTFALEMAAWSFVRQWPNKHQSLFWYDWMIRDFFGWLLNFKNAPATVPGTGEIIPLGDAWYSRCESAYSRALKACEYEYYDQADHAGEEWQKIFGTQFSAIEGLLRAMLG